MGTNARTRIDVVARVSYLLSCALLFGVAVVLVPAIVPVSLSLRKTTATATTHAFAFAFAFSPIPLPTTNTRTHTGRTTTTAGWNCNWNSNGNLPWELLQAPRLHHHHHHHHHHRQWRIQNPKACSRWLQRTSSLTAATEIEAETEASFSENSGSSSNSTAGTESSSMTSTAMESQPQPQPLPIRYNPALLRYRCRISYDGTSFSGFQLQGGRSDADSDGGSQRSGTNRNNAKDKRKDKRKHQKTPPRTIQGELERVLSTRFQRVVRVTGAGRTDGGVHARGQAIHFDLYHNETYTATQRQTPTQAQTLDNNNNNNDNDNHDREREFDRDLEHTLNRMLPEDIRAWNLGRTTPTAVNANAEGTGTSTAPPGLYNWNAMRTSTAKLYSYRISVGDAMDPTERHHRWQIPWQSIDPSRLERVLKTFEGTHDFVCFAGALEQQQKKTGIVVGTVRTIHRIDLVKESTAGKRGNGNGNAAAQNAGTIATPSCDDYYYRIDVYLDGALYKMVRNIVGTAVDACRDWIDDEWLEDLLQNPGDLGYTRKDNPCMPAPPNGLTLERVFYPDDDVF